MDSYDLDIYQGQTFALSLVVNDINGSPLNLSGYAISGFLRTRYSDSGALANLNVTIADPANGVVSMGMVPSGTSQLPINYAFYDIEMMNTGNGVVTRVLQGKASVYPEAAW